MRLWDRAYQLEEEKNLPKLCTAQHFFGWFTCDTQSLMDFWNHFNYPVIFRFPVCKTKLIEWKWELSLVFKVCIIIILLMIKLYTMEQVNIARKEISVRNIECINRTTANRGNEKLWSVCKYSIPFLIQFSRFVDQLK